MPVEAPEVPVDTPRGSSFFCLACTNPPQAFPQCVSWHRPSAWGRWRVKLVLPFFAALPLLAAYSGGTGVAVPKPLQAWLGLPFYLELGVLYKVRRRPTESWDCCAKSDRARGTAALIAPSASAGLRAAFC